MGFGRRAPSLVRGLPDAQVSGTIAQPQAQFCCRSCVPVSLSTIVLHGTSKHVNTAMQTSLVGRASSCVRGVQGTSSFRVYEALSAGRVPVIISDDWVAPTGPDWSRFSVRWPEERVAELREVLNAYDDEWWEMSVAAEEAYAQFFAPDVWFHRFAELCSELRQPPRNAFPERGIRRSAYWASGAHAWHGRVHHWRGWLRRHMMRHCPRT